QRKAEHALLAESLLDKINERARKILKKRFGLSGKKKETLEKIGKDFGITRERVRQIIADSFRRINKLRNEKEVSDFLKKVVFTLEKRDGIISQEEALRELAGNDAGEMNAFSFLVRCFPEIETVERENFIRPSWALRSVSLENIRKIEEAALSSLEKEQRPMTLGKLSGLIEKSLENRFKTEQISNWLKVLSRVMANSFGKWGIAKWSEIQPKNTRDKIYLVLKENKKPLHFREIAKKIDLFELSKKKAHPQTVHNELIKDKRFVLIGRGIYAIAEWGYSKGTVRDVLESILRERGTLEREAIFEEVFKQRKVKKATVMINLNNSEIFSKKGNSYSLRK
ncbi:MAG: sigma factor-like helix-turn-helix DNA-binding protein, partial [Patescibacteria group bacterium]